MLYCISSYYKNEGGTTVNNPVKKRFFRLFIFTLCTLLIIYLLFLLYHFTGIGFKCIFFEITGFKCAGCGNTHAIQSLLELDIMKSFSYNYIYPVEFFYVLWVYLNSSQNYLKNGKFNYKSPYQIIDILVLVAVVLWVPLRNILGV